MTATPPYYTVYEAQYRRLPIFHAAVYIEVDAQGGWIYQAVGTHRTGFQVEVKRTDRPERSRSFYRKWERGKIEPDRLEDVADVARNVPPPGIKRPAKGVEMREDCRDWVREFLIQLKKRELLVIEEKEKEKDVLMADADG